MHTSLKPEFELPLTAINKDFFDLFERYLKNRFNRKVFQPFVEADIQKIFTENAPGKRGQGAKAFFKILDSTIVEHSMNLHNPLYMGHQVPPTLPIACLTDLIISMMNQSLVVKKMSPALSLIEQETINFLINTIGYNAKAGGTFTSGGSISNFLGLFGARKKYFKKTIPPKAMVICSDQTHYSVSKAVNMLGLSNDNIAIIETDNHFHINIAQTEKKIVSLKQQGFIPFVISANAGSTSTGSFDNLKELATIARKQNLWLHVDAAHGGSLIFSEELNYLIEGISKADSITWDAHKMMYMPASTGICLFKDKKLLKNCFIDSEAPYLYNSDESKNDLSRQSIQCTRRGDALKLWGSLVTYGSDFFAERYRHIAKVTQYFYNRINTCKNFEALHKPEFNIFCFRYNPANKSYSEEKLNKINSQIRDLANDTGEIMLTLTFIKEKVSLRATIINPATTTEHIDQAIKIIEQVIP